MANENKIKLFKPNFVIKKNKIPTIFIDTFMWSKVFKSNKIENLLAKCCKTKKLLVLITSIQEGELRRRNFMEKIKEICGENYLIVSTGHILANQVIHSMISYYEGVNNVELSWNISISEVPILKPPKVNLKKIITHFVDEMNKLRKVIGRNKNIFISGLVQVERDIWMKELKLYWELIPEFSKKHNSTKSYEEFFYSDYFADLPSIILISYLFGYILKERKIKVQDVIDVYNISEAVPYTILSILDKDQYNRLLLLKRDYPQLFKNLFEYVYISSFHDKAPNPERALESFLKWCLCA